MTMIKSCWLLGSYTACWTAWCSLVCGQYWPINESVGINTDMGQNAMILVPSTVPIIPSKSSRPRKPVTKKETVELKHDLSLPSQLATFCVETPSSLNLVIWKRCSGQHWYYDQVAFRGVKLRGWDDEFHIKNTASLPESPTNMIP